MGGTTYNVRITPGTLKLKSRQVWGGITNSSEWAFGTSGGSQYGLASAVAILIAVLTIGISAINFRVAGVFKEARR